MSTNPYLANIARREKQHNPPQAPLSPAVASAMRYGLVCAGRASSVTVVVYLLWWLLSSLGRARIGDDIKVGSPRDLQHDTLTFDDSLGDAAPPDNAVIGSASPVALV
jgi:hypothetical protein